MKQSPEIREYLSAQGRKGGAARAAKLTPARRSEIAKGAVQAREAKRAKEKEAGK